MSLATFLLGAGKSSDKKKVIDNELDALFHSRAKPGSTGLYSTRENKKRGVEVHADEPSRKRSKTTDAISSSLLPAGDHKKNGESRVRVMSIERGIVDVTPRPKQPKSVPSDESGLESSDEDGDDPSPLVHETLRKERPRKLASKRTKYVPADESKETRDARTVFIGNLAPDVALKRPLKKQLYRHILDHVPTAKIESTRFRSVAFQTPTSKLPETDEDVKKKEPRQHERDRASSWRGGHVTDESKANEKKFLTPSQKKKIAFINGNIHSDAGSVHAYVVFAYPVPHSRSSDLPHLPPAMDPFEAARLAVEKCNGTMFLNRMLRVDAVVKHSTTDHSPESAHIGDPKLTVFVGNLDFASNEEDLRIFFEGVVSTELGPSDTTGTHDGDESRQWVTRVRIIRDRDTQLGKGFAYVQFSDRTCVDEILALEPDKLKFAKRKLRVQRCKSIPNVTKHAKHDHSSHAKPVQKPGFTRVPPVPKGDPSLGEKLVKLNKEERKRVKAADADRVARRIAKKKARLALAKQGVAHKQRERVRKMDTAKQARPPKKISKGRVRSEKSIAKKNMKK